MIDKPTHFFRGGCSCIDLIFCNKPELISEYGIDHSLFQTCHHNLSFAKIKAKISVHPAYSREVLDDINANAEVIQQFTSRLNCKKLFEIYQLMRKLTFLTQHYQIYFVTIFQTKLSNVVIGTPHD